jgi:WD40 repeat protein
MFPARVRLIGLVVAVCWLLQVNEARTEPPEEPLPEGALARLGTLRWRHGSAVYYVAFLPDGKGVVTGGQDGIVRLWDRRTGKEIRRFGKAHATVPGIGSALRLAVSSLALSADGKLLASTSEANVRLQEVDTGKELQIIKGPVNGVTALAFSPDRKLLAGRAFDRTIYLWDPDSGKEIRQIKNTPKEARGGVVFSFGGSTAGLVFSHDGKTLASIEIELEKARIVSFIRLSEVETGKEILRIPSDQPNLSGLACSPIDKMLAYSSGDTIRLCRTDTGKEIRKIKAGPGGQSLVFSPDGKTLASRNSITRQITLHAVETGEEIRRLGEASEAPAGVVFVAQGWGGAPQARDLDFSPDGKVIVAAVLNTLCFWDAGTGKELADQGGHRGPVTAVLLASDGKTALSMSSDNTIRRWEWATGKELNRFQFPAGTTCIALGADARTVAVGNRDRSVRLHDTTSGKEGKKLTEHTGLPLALAFSPDGKILASRGSDNTLRLTDTTTAKELKQIALGVPANPANPGGFMLNAMAPAGPGPVFSPDGRLLALAIITQVNAWVGRVPAATPGNSIHLFALPTGKEVCRIELAANRGVAGMAFSPDRRTLAVENSDQTISLYETAGGKERLQLGTAAKAPGPVAVGGGVMVIANIQGFGTPAIGSTLLFTPDGRQLVTRAGPQVRVWDVLAGKELEPFKGHQGDVKALAMSADGKLAASGSDDTTILLWDLTRRKTAARTPVELSAREVETRWADLLTEDAGKAFRTVQTLAAAPKPTVAFLKEQLKPLAGVDPKVLDRLIGDLESDDFPVRKKALEELEKLDELALPALNRLLGGSPSLEARRRAEQLLDKLTGRQLSNEQLRQVRAVEVLESIGSPEVRQLLLTLSRGAPGGLLTREATDALNRLEHGR